MGLSKIIQEEIKLHIVQLENC